MTEYTESHGLTRGFIDIATGWLLVLAMLVGGLYLPGLL